MKVTSDHASAHLSQMVDAVFAGKEIVTVKEAGSQLVPVEKTGFKFGILKDKIGPSPDFLEPMSEDELALWEGEGAETAT